MMRWLAAGFESWTIISLLVLFAQGLEFLHQPLNITISVGGDGYIPCELSPPIPPTWSINGMLYPSSGQLPEHHRYNYTGLVIENAGVGMNGSCYFCYLVIYNGVYKSRTGCVTITKEAIPCSTPFMIEVTTVKILETSQLAQVIMSSSPKMITFNSTIPSLTKYTSYNEPIVAGASVFKSNYYVTSTVLNTGDEQPKNFVLKTNILLGIASLLGIIAVMFLTCLSALILLIKKSKQKKERNPEQVIYDEVGPPKIVKTTQNPAYAVNIHTHPNSAYAMVPFSSTR